MSVNDKMIAGVCGGLAETFGIDALLLRVAFIILIFFNGIGLIAYLILMLVLPKGEPERPVEIDITPEKESDKKLHRLNKNKMIAGICSGMEKYFGVDVSIIRILFVVVTLLTGGLGIVLYIMFWVILPLEY